MTDMVIPPEAADAPVTVHLTGPGAQFVTGTSFPSGATKAADIKALVETATRLGRLLGRKEAGEEMAAAFEAFFPDPHAETEACEDCMVVHEFAAIARNIAAREIATKEPK